MSLKKESLFKQKLNQAKIEKQKSQKTNSTESQEVQSFPKVFKIDNFHIQRPQPSQSLQQQINAPDLSQLQSRINNTTAIEQIPYLQKHKQSLNNIISEDELNQINNENWNAVDSMNQEERQNYVNLIQNTLPANFIEKLKKKKLQQQSQINSNVKTPSSTLSQKLPQTKPTESNQAPKINAIEQNQKIIEEINQGKPQPQQVQDQTQSHKTVIGNIHLNIKTSKLTYLHENVHLTLTSDEKTSLVSLAKIYEMTTSDNNQSQIIGAQLTLEWVKSIFPNSNTVFFIDTVPFHSQIMLMQIYPLFKSIQTNLKTTKFYSCYVQLIVKSVQILTCIYKSLSDDQLDEQIKFSQSQFQKSQKSLKNFIHQSQSKHQKTQSQTQLKQSKEMLYESLGILFQSLKQEKTLRTDNLKNQRQAIEIEEKFQKLKSPAKINDLIEACLIEQTLKQQEFEQYLIQPSINYFLQTLTNFWSTKIQENLQNLTEKLSDAHQFYDALYKFICRFNQKKRHFSFYSSLVQKIFEGLLEILESCYLKNVLEEILSKKFTDKIVLKKSTSLNNLKGSIVFKILYVYQTLSGKSDKLATFLQSSKMNWTITEEQANIMVYINFSHYLGANDLKAEQIEMLQKAFKWIINQLKDRNTKQLNCCLDSEQTLITLLGLFLSEQQVYSLIDQTLLNQVFKDAIQFYESETTKENKSNLQSGQGILTEQQIKKMIQNYNYNSFGNDIFTKVMFWVAVTISPQVQALIAEEVMMRYPMLFYYASQSQFGSTLSEQLKCTKKDSQRPLLGNILLYIKKDKNQKQGSFSYISNEQVKANLLKLLFLNLDFSETKNIDHESLKKIISRQSEEQTHGFHLNKAKLNESNYFYRYLIEPFSKVQQYKQLF